MNACRALVKPDCTKPKVVKAAGIQNALVPLLSTIITKENQNTQQSESSDKTSLPSAPVKHDIQHELSEQKLFWSRVKQIPEFIKNHVNVATYEFAGIKFKANVITGSQYIHFLESVIRRDILRQLPFLQRLIICEEKYSFTPDDFKAATRCQRKSRKESITHLKDTHEVLNSDAFDKQTIVTTAEGKSLISTYLARNISKLNINQPFTIDIDSEYLIEGCICHKEQNEGQNCGCSKYSIPMRHIFTESSLSRSYTLDHIRQCKGEAEMAQADWLTDIMSELKPNQAVASIVSSGDIDSMLIHLYMISHLWPRNQCEFFKNTVFVILQKPGKVLDVYSITGIIELIECVRTEENVFQYFTL